MADFKFSSLTTSSGKLKLENTMANSQNIKNKIQKQKQKIFESQRPYQTYPERVVSDFKNTWKTIKEDALASSIDRIPSELKKKTLFGALGSDLKLGIRATGLATREVTSPISSLFSGLLGGGGYSEGTQQKSKLESGLKLVSLPFEKAQESGQEFLQKSGVDPLTARLASEGAINIATGEVGASIFSKARNFKKFKSLEEVNNLKSKIKSDIISNLPVDKEIFSEPKSTFISETIDKFFTKVDNGEATKTDLKEIKTTLKESGATNTKQLDEVYETQFKKDTKTETDGKILSDIETKTHTTKSKNPDTSLLISKKIINYENRYTPDTTSKETRKVINEDFGGDINRFNKTVEDFSSTIRNTKTYEGKLYQLSKLNEDKAIKKESKEYYKQIEDKVALLEELSDAGFVERKVDLQYNNTKDGLFEGYKLTKKGQQLARDIGYSEGRIKSMSEKQFAHVPKEDIRQYQIRKNPDLLNNKERYESIDKLLYEEDGFTDTPNSIDGFKKQLKKLYIVKGFDLEKELSKIDKSKGGATVQKLLELYNKIQKYNRGKIGSIKGVKPKSTIDTSKVVEKVMLENEGLADEIISEKLYSKTEKNIEVKFKDKVKKLIAKYKDKEAILKNALYEANKKRLVDLYELNAKYKNYAKLKAIKVNEIRLEFKAGRLYGEIDKAINKVTKGNIMLKKEKTPSLWQTADNPKDLQTVFERLDKAVAKADLEGIIQLIRDELSDVVIPKKGMPSQKRKGLTPRIERDLFEARAKFEAGIKGRTPNREELLDLLDKIKQDKAESIRQAVERETERLTAVSKSLDKIGKEGYNTKIIGLKDLDNTAGLKEIIKAGLKDFSNYNKPIIFYFEKIFGATISGKINEGVKVFWADIKEGFNKIAEFEKTFITPLAQDFLNKFSDSERFDWGVSLIARQIDKDRIGNGTQYVGFDRLLNDPSKKQYLEARTSSVGNKPEWLSDEYWHGREADIKNNKKAIPSIKDTKLGELLERAETDTKWIEFRKNWNEVQEKIGSAYKRVIEDYDGIDINLRDDYFYLLTKNYISRVDLDGVDFLDIRPGKKNSIELVESVDGKNITYEADPVAVLLKGSRQPLIQIFLRRELEKAIGVLNGKQKKFARLSNEEISKLLSDTTEDGTRVWKITDRYGNVIEDLSDTSPEGIRLYREGPDAEKLYLTAIGQGIKNKLPDSNVKFITEYLQRVSRGGNFQRDVASRYILKFTNNITANFMIGNLGSIAVQPLSFLDNTFLSGSRFTFRALDLIRNNPDILKEVEQISLSLKNRRGATVEIGEILQDIDRFQKLSKLGKGYNTYVKYGMAPLKGLDAITYKLIWLTNVLEYFEKNGIDFDQRLANTPEYWEASKYADVQADKIAGSADAFNQPKVYENILGKTFFALSGQFNSRYFTYAQAIENAFVNKQYGQGAKLLGYYAGSNMVSKLVPFFIAVELYNLGLSNYDPREYGSAEDIIYSADGLFQATIGSQPIINKVVGFTEFGAYDVIGATSKSISKAIGEIKNYEDGDSQLKILSDFIKSIGFKKPIEVGQAVFGEK